MTKITRLILILGTTLGLMGCAVYPAGPVAYAGPAYYGPPVAVGVYGGGWHHGWRG